MINIFNLFLFLLTLWLLFMVAEDQVNFEFTLSGILVSFVLSIISYQLKLVEKKSELLYLSLRFYKHFFKIYFNNFFSGISLIFDLSLGLKSFHPTIHRLALYENYNFNPALILATLNMTTGLFAIAFENNCIVVHTVDEEYFYNFDLLKTSISLNEINDDNLL